MFANAMAQVVQSLVQVGGTTCSISTGAKLALKATRTRAVEASAFLTVALILLCYKVDSALKNSGIFVPL